MPRIENNFKWMTVCRISNNEQDVDVADMQGLVRGIVNKNTEQQANFKQLIVSGDCTKGGRKTQCGGKRIKKIRICDEIC